MTSKKNSNDDDDDDDEDGDEWHDWQMNVKYIYIKMWMHIPWKCTNNYNNNNQRRDKKK